MSFSVVTNFSCKYAIVADIEKCNFYKNFYFM